ncbi:knotted 1-binding protein [Perilla frutescens var. frutescens]|nr:knotted 1-binding protein [Perilla frutescens var. frutescens]
MMALVECKTHEEFCMPSPLFYVEDKQITMEDGSLVQVPAEENVVTSNSEQVEMEISHILEKINNFTQTVSELLESGKSMLKEMSNGFEERMILIHKEQIEKWQEEIKELRLLDTANEEIVAVLQNAAYLLQSVTVGS